MLAGHLWTIAPRLRHAARRTAVDGRPWRAEADDSPWGPIALSGRLSEVPGCRRLVVLVHGLGGCSESHYMIPAAAACGEIGASCLQLNLRGADLAGEDLYHAGLTSDLAAALASEALADYDSIVILGFSLGGHVVLRYATEEPDRRLAAVAAVCTPLDLALAQQGIDRPASWLYRSYLLARLRRIYRPVHRRRGLETRWEEVAAVRTIREWDRLVVVPRFGFADVADYYATASVAGRLGELRVPALAIASVNDPMVAPEAIPGEAARASDLLDLRWIDRGGHVGFPADLDLGLDAPLGLERQVLAWLLERTR